MLSEESLTQNSAFMAILSGLGATSTYNLYRTSQTYNLILLIMEKNTKLKLILLNFL